jgi:hypothetical protein
LVYIDGVVQAPVNYTIASGNPLTIVFSTAIPNGSQVVIVCMGSASQGTLDGVTINGATINTATINNLTATGTLALPAGSVTSAMILNGTIVDADINAAAAIATNKLAPVTATGSTTARTLQDRFADLASVKDFGAVGDGVADDTAAIQAAITASYGQTLYIPSGTYKISSTITINDKIHLLGDSRFSTFIQWSNATLGAFNITTDIAISVEHIAFAALILPTAGYTFQFTGGATNNAFSSFRNITFSYSYIAIKSLKAMTLSVSTCYFFGHQNAGILVQNNYQADAGDSTIVDCVFSGAGASASGILQYSSGGLKVLGTKIIDGAYGIRQSLASTAITSDLLINGNSIERYSIAAIQLDLQGVGGEFANVVINGNQIASAGAAAGSSGIIFNSATQYLAHVNISGNIITLPAGTTYGILLGNIIGGVVNGNHIVGVAGQNSTGIAFTSSSTNTIFSGNCFVNCLYNINNLNGSFNGQYFILGQSSQNVAVPSQTTEYAWATLPIPAYTLGSNGLIRVKGRMLCTNNANAKTLRVRLGGISGTIVFSAAAANSAYVTFSCEIGNTATNVQSTVGDYVKDATPVSPVGIASAIDTTALQNLVISGQKATAGDTCILLNYAVEIIQS